MAAGRNKSKPKHRPNQKTLWKSIFREIWQTPSRFIAILAITALGTGFFAGLKATGPDMLSTGQYYFTSRNLMDFRLLSTMGFTQEDIDLLQNREDIEVVMAGYGMDLLVHREDKEQAVRFHSIPEDEWQEGSGSLNRISITEGRMPQKADECLADDDSSIKIGEKIRLAESNNQDMLDMVAVREFTVVGLAKSPLYIIPSRGNTNIGNGRLNSFLYVMPSAFDSEYYTELFLTVKGASSLAFYSDDYKDLIGDTSDSLKKFAEERSQVRFDEIHKEAAEKLEDARRELADKREEADQKLADALKKLLDAETEIADGEAELNRNAAKLKDAAAEIESGQQTLNSARSELERRQAEYEAGVAQLSDKRKEYEAGLAEYNRQLAAFNQAESQLNAMQQAVDGLEQGSAGLAGILAQIAAAQTPEEKAALEQAFQQAAGEVIGGIRQLAAALEAAGMADQAVALSAAADSAGGMLAAGQYDAVVQITSAVPAQLRPELEKSRQALEAGRPALEAAGAQLQQAAAAIAAAEQQLAAGKAALDGGWQQLAAGENSMADARRQLEDGKTKLADARTKLADARAELDDGWKEYRENEAEAEEKFAEAEQEIEENQQKLDDVKRPEWFVLDRDTNPGYAGFASDADRIKAIAAVIPPFFFLVAALVCLTTMTRMVEEQRTQIGTLKALGFGKRTIAMKFLTYAGTASVAGSLLGILVGFLVFPPTIWSAYSIMYNMIPLKPGNNTLLAFVSVAAMVACNVAATLASCYGELRSVPAALMRPKAPRSGSRVFLERIPFIWKRLKFSQKVTVRNLMRYKKRFFMTVVGVAGCTALLLTGFGVRDSITGIISRQFGVLSDYDLAGSLVDPSDSKADTELNRLAPQLGDMLYFQQTAVEARAGRENNAGMTTFLFVPENAQTLHEFIILQQRVGGQAIEFPQGDHVVVTEKLAKRLKLEVGSTFELNRSGEKEVTVTVGGIAENYVQNYIYMAAETYSKLMNAEPEFTSFFMRLPENPKFSEQETLSKLVDTKGVAGVMNMADLKSNLDDMLKSLDSVVWLIIVSAAALAFVVLFNLTNINITERAREIATLKVLGFYNKEVASYVYRENLLLTLIGIAVGLVGGIFLHRFVIVTAEIDEVMFRRLILPLSYVWSALFTLACAMIVNLVMLRRLHRIDMVESLKSAE